MAPAEARCSKSAQIGLRTVSIWRAAVTATHELLSPEDRNEIELEAEAYPLSAALWVAIDAQDQQVAFMGLGVGARRRCLSIQITGEKALAELSSPSQRPCIRWT